MFSSLMQDAFVIMGGRVGAVHGHKNTMIVAGGSVSWNSPHNYSPGIAYSSCENLTAFLSAANANNIRAMLSSHFSR